MGHDNSILIIEIWTKSQLGIVIEIQIDNLLDQLKGDKYFRTIDMKLG